jgi:hypothetical protein
MAFNQVGDFWLAPGQSTRVHIALGGLVNEAEWGGHDFGAQWIMADGSGSIRCGSWSASTPKRRSPFACIPVRQAPSSIR